MLEAVEEAQARLNTPTGKDQKETWAESLITAVIQNLEVVCLLIQRAKAQIILNKYMDSDGRHSLSDC